MTQLHRTLYKLRDDNLITRWEPLGNDSSPTGALVQLTNGEKICVVIGDDYYIVNLSDITEVYGQYKKIDYVIINDWQEKRITQQAQEFCDNNRIKVISYTQLRKHLHESK